MSDTRREPSRPLGSPILSWLGAASYVLVAFGVIAAAHFATRPTKPATAANREQHLQLRRYHHHRQNHPLNPCHHLCRHPLT